MVVLLFHRLQKRPELGIGWQTPKQFENLIIRFKESGFVNGRSEELPKARPDDRKLLITFDDGYEGVYEFGLPILRRHGFTALVFLVAGYLGQKNFWDMRVLQRFKHLGWDELLELKRVGFEFGSHTMTHPDLTLVSPKRQEWELKESKMVLEERLGPILCLSYPFGRYDEQLKSVIERVGYKLAFTVFPKREDLPFNPLAIKRTPVHLIDPWWFLRAELERPDSFWARCGQVKGKLVNFLSRGTPLMRKKDYSTKDGVQGYAL